MNSKVLNYEFRVLQAFAIILIVLGHSGGISLLTDWFPTDAFSVPLFIFISGYFYKKNSEDDVISFIKRKIKKFIIPLAICNLIYGSIITVLLNNGVVNYGHKLGLRSFFIEPWTLGNQFGLNVPSWFVTAFFLVQVVYIIIRKVFSKLKLNNEYILTFSLYLIGLISICLSNRGYNSGWWLTLVRIGFLIQFYQIGYMYKEKWEEKDKLSNITYFIILFIVQYVFIFRYGDVKSIVFSGVFNKENIFAPFITSMLGIMLWLRISKIVTPILKGSKIMNYIAGNTWTIMMHHQFVFFCVNFIFLQIATRRILPGFEIESFRNFDWYKYNPKNNGFMLLYCILGISVPLLVKYYFNKYIIIKRNKSI